MKKIEIEVDGKKYPCRPTMGAMLRFKNETGHDITQMKDGDLSDVCTYLWCCVKSACEKDKVDFGMDLMEFADSISVEDMVSWNQSIGESGRATRPAPTSEKKSR